MQQAETLFRNQLQHIIYLAVLITFAVVIHTVEAALPLPMPVPGVRLGLANIITLLALIIFGLRSAVVITVARSVLGSIFVGGLFGFGFWLSLSAGVVSTAFMALVLYFEHKGAVSLLSVSVLGAVAHNLTQLALAALIIGNVALLQGYYPLLLLLSVPTGIFTGAAAHYLQETMKKMMGQSMVGAER